MTDPNTTPRVPPAVPPAYTDEYPVPQAGDHPARGTRARTSALDRIVRWAIFNRMAVLFGVLLLIGGGIWAASTLRVEALPDLTDVQVQVLVEAPGLSPVEVERLVAFPVEVAMNGLPDVSQVRSISKYGFAAVTTVFKDGVDPYFARTLVNERLQSVAEGLPPQAEASLGPFAGAISEIYLYTVEGGDKDLTELRTLHDRIVRPQLRTVPGVVEVNAFGGYVKQVQVTIYPERLVAFGLTLHDVVEGIEANSAVAAGGYIEHRDEQYILRGLGQATGPQDLARTVLRTSNRGVPVLVGDVASVDYGPELRQGAVTRDGKGEVVSGIVMMRRGESSREVVRQVRARVAEINRSLPKGVRVAPYYDQTDLVAGTFRTVLRNGAEGLFLVVAVLLLFLGNVRAALVVAATIPLSLLFAFLGMRWLGISANLMSLGAIDFGMIVDGAVVQAEHMVKKLHDDEQEGTLPRDRASLFARLFAISREVARPILFGVLIILLVYIPILSLAGIEGRLFRPMAVTVAIALFGSLILALVFVPAASTWLFRRGARESKYAERLAHWLESRYTPVARRVLRVPGRALAVASVAAGAVALFVLPQLGTEFIPELDEGSITIQAARDPSVSLTRSVEMQRDVERTLKTFPEVTTVVSRVGRAEVGSDPMGVNLADIFVMLKPRDEWRDGMSKPELVEAMEKALTGRVPGLAYTFTQPMAMRLDELIAGVRGDVAIKVFGEDADSNRVAAQRIAQVVQRIEGAAEVQVEATQGQTYLNVILNREAMARFGIPVAEVQEALETAVGGRPVSQVVEGNYGVDVVVQYPMALRSSPEALAAITIPASSGARIPLGQLADIRLQSGPLQVSRERAQRLVVVSTSVRGRDLGGFAEEVQETVGSRVSLPPGVFVTYGGEFENQQRAMSRLTLVVPVSIALIAALLWASLRSGALAGLVLLNLPFAAVGGILALWARGLHLSVSAVLGVIALFGVAVLNALVAMSTIQTLRREGRSPEEAALEGARERLRPVLMTALVASLGFIPAALSHGTGAEVQRPLATVVIGGLVTSTAATLFLLPTLYAWYTRWEEARRARRRAARVAREADEAAAMGALATQTEG